MDNYGRVIAGILLIVLLIIKPLSTIAFSQEEIKNDIVKDMSYEFMNEIREKGYLKAEEYEAFLKRIGSGGDLYNVEIELAKLITVTEEESSNDIENRVMNVSMKRMEGEEIHANKFSGTIMRCDQEQIHTDICEHNEVTNLELMSVEDNIELRLLATSTHVHKQDNNCVWTGATVITHQPCSYCGDNMGVILYTQAIAAGKSAGTTIGSNRVCSVCGKTNTYSSSKRRYQFTYNYKCGAIQVVDGTSRASDTNYMYPAGAHVHTDACYRGAKHVHNSNCYSEEEYETGYWGTNYVYADCPGPPSCTVESAHEHLRYTETYWVSTGTDTRTVLSCSRSTSKYYYNGVEESPICSQVVTQVEAKSPIQSVNQNDEITAFDRTIIVTYLDGNKEEIQATSVEGFDTNVPDTYIVKLNYEGFIDNAKTTGKRSTEVYLTVIPRTTFCDYGHEYLLSDTGEDLGCPICMNTLSYISATKTFLTYELGEQIELDVEVIATFLDNHTEYVTGWISNYDPNSLGIQTVTISYLGKATTLQVKIVKNYVCDECGTEYPSDSDGNDPGCPNCNNKVINLRVDVLKDIYNTGEELQVKVYEVYKDREEEITDWTTNYNSYVAGEQMVSVFHNNLSYEFPVTVISKHLVKCPICGNEYDKTEFGWCVICRDTIAAIAVNEEKSEHIVYKGTTPEITVTIIFRDGYKIDITSGFKLLNFKSYIVGKQNAEIDYKGFRVIYKVQVIEEERKTNTCDKGHTYYLNEDGSDPGCPYCINTDSGEMLHYVNIMYNDELLEKLYRDKIIDFASGDYIVLRITKSTDSVTSRLQRLVPLSIGEVKEEQFVYGGEVL